MKSFNERFSQELSVFENSLEKQIQSTNKHFGSQELIKAMRYALLGGGKRFRPLLTLLTAQALEKEESSVLPWAMAVECIHAYSLAHDDLPSMDDSELRRGRPSLHKIYGEAMAILAGDALQALAFSLLSNSRSIQTAQALKVIALLAKAIGHKGMVVGQAMDMNPQESGDSASVLECLRQTYQLKTGALIHASVYGTALLFSDVPDKQVRGLDTYGKQLGLAFQLADDLLDFNSNDQEFGYPKVLGIGGTQKLLREANTEALVALKGFGEKAQPLRELVEFNQGRVD